MDGWLGATRESLRHTLGNIALLRAEIEARRKSADQQRRVLEALQATAHVLDMPLDATCLKRSYGICLEAEALPRQRNGGAEAEEKELDEEGEDNHSPKRERRDLQRRDERVHPHAAAVLYWEKMDSNQTIRVIFSFLPLQGIHDLGLTCQPLYRLLFLFSSSGSGTAAEGAVTSFVGAPLRTEWCFKHFIGSAPSTTKAHPRVISLTMSSDDSLYYLRCHLNAALLLGRFQRLQVLEMTGTIRMPLSFLFSEIARLLASGNVPHLRTLSLEAPRGLNDDDQEDYGGANNAGSFFHHLHNVCNQGLLANLEQLTLSFGFWPHNGKVRREWRKMRLRGGYGVVA